MDPKVWGPGMWSAIHGVAAYGRDVQEIKNFYQHLAVPCSTCQGHLDDFRKENAPDSIQSREGAFLWSLRLHNSVNEKLGKSLFSLNQCWDAHCSPTAQIGSMDKAFTAEAGHVFLNRALIKTL